MLDRFFYDIPFHVFEITFIAILAICSQVGLVLGRRHMQREDDATRTGIENLQSSVLGLVALLLAFCFSMAMSRHDERRRLVIREANAIGTTALRTTLLPAPHGKEIRGLLKEYVHSRLALSDARNDQARFDQASLQAENIQVKLWSQATATSQIMKDPARLTLFFNPLNEVIDLHTERKSSLQNRVPGVILGVLCLMCFLSITIVGFSWGMGQKQHVALRLVLIVLLSLTMTLIIDLDRPGRGRIQVSDQPIEDLLPLIDTLR